ncbi:MAG: hypothetical protein K6G17_07920 [Oscillospiraceae bacterium]|nr:hypothetical protein [Oscillospiraceae bacterium]
MKGKTAFWLLILFFALLRLLFPLPAAQRRAAARALGLESERVAALAGPDGAAEWREAFAGQP